MVGNAPAKASDVHSKWERPESVEKFATREADVRLLELLATYSEPAVVRVLDLGCAAGRNTVMLAEHGFDVHARDASRAMIERTRSRTASLLGTVEAERRVRLGRMDDLRDFDDSLFDLVVALGIYHCAASREEWDCALAEAARVLAPGGLLLVSVFTPQTDPTGEGLRPVPGEPHVYEGFSAGRTFLVGADKLDSAMAQVGLAPRVPSQVVRTETGTGHRVVINALYEKGA